MGFANAEMPDSGQMRKLSSHSYIPIIIGIELRGCTEFRHEWRETASRPRPLVARPLLFNAVFSFPGDDESYYDWVKLHFSAVYSPFLEARAREIRVNG